MRREPPGFRVLSLREETGIAAGGRGIEEVAIGAVLVALTRLVSGSALLRSAAFGSAALISTALVSAALVSAALGSGTFGSGGASSDRVASAGRGRGNGLAGACTGAGIVTIELNIGDGGGPAWRNSA